MWKKGEIWLSLAVVFISLMVESAEFGCDYEPNQKWSVIGIYSACYNKTNRTKFNKQAEDLDTSVKYMWKQRATDFFTDRKPINVTYISFDV